MSKDTIYREDAIKAINLKARIPHDVASAHYASISINAICSVPFADRPQEWTPCSERLPKRQGHYICTCKDGSKYKRTTVVKWSNGWQLTGSRAYWIVIAWMPLPNPWEGADLQKAYDDGYKCGRLDALAELLKYIGEMGDYGDDRKTEQTEPSDDWICNTCKYHNIERAVQCKMCGDGGQYEPKQTENSSEKPNNCEDWQDWKDRMWAEAIVTEPQTDCNGCKFVGTYDTEFSCANCSRKTKDYYAKDEPQTERSE